MTVAGWKAVRSASGRLRKKAQLAFSCSRSGGCSAMLRALRAVLVLSLAGQASTHKPHPVQSSGETWMVNLAPGNSLNLASRLLKEAGALASRPGAYTFWRITACGQTIEHLPHWMHKALSQTGISRVMLRFSHWVVPLGKVPSIGIALTGRESPSFAIIWPSTFRTNSGAASGTAGRRLIFESALRPSSLISFRCARVWSTASKFFFTTASPRLP